MPSSFLTTAFSDLTGTPTTIAGYGITDASHGDYTNLTKCAPILTDLTDLGTLRRNKWTSITNRWSRNFSFVNLSMAAALRLGV